ncbi:FAD-binding domain-containing protein [Mycena alexandri]|uniref:FAD-binding domain-containing protein n=1 Tax=Mycena alexandri TaxID=1745969 RepID=A0AAD6S090_9AGAR|nr:FAD-binding domain-containing protein [Mycena alexandri]
MASWKKIGIALALSSVFPATQALSEVCTEIQRAISHASAVYSPSGSGNYTADNAHWVASSIEESACTVEPATAADVSAIIKIIGKTKTPFAVKSGGHATNPGYSSTTGVQIAMTRFNAVKYDKKSGTVAIGAGQIWDDVYAKLEPLGVVAPGGRVPGVGVGGFTLGGGYNWLSNQVGLTVDIVVSYELVKPNGDIVTVTQTSSPDLFFALKGGYNNFGIVTQFTYKAFPIDKVWGGLIAYGAAQTAEFNTAFANFAANAADPKAALVSGYALDATGAPIVGNIMFYDGPTPPPGVFDAFLKIKNISSDIGTRTLSSLVASAPQTLPAGTRGYFNTMSFFEYTDAIATAILNETTFWGPVVAKYDPSALAGYHMETFYKSFLTHNTTATAWPFYRSKKFVPLQMQFTWNNPKVDKIMQGFMEQSAAHLTVVANRDGQPIQQLPLYPNYGLFSNGAERVYGSNLPRLKAIKGQVDPQNVMGLAGGWKV